MRRQAGAVLIAVFALAACAPTGGGGPVVWLIPAGSHDATGATASLRTSDVIAFSTRFDASAQYSTIDPVNQFDINKLRGFSDCSAHHQTDSARFGWRWTTDRVEIFAYDYVGGERQSALLGSVQPGVWHDYRIDAIATGYLFTLDGIVTAMPRGCSDLGLAKYELWPYFGGDEVAPHAISIEIDEHSA